MIPSSASVVRLARAWLPKALRHAQNFVKLLPQLAEYVVEQFVS
jgi:hypothetical protein